MSEWLGILMLAVVVLGIIGLIISVYIGKTHQRSHKDDEAPAAAKNNMLSNPILLLNILFPVITFIGAAIFYYYFLAR